MGNSLNLVHIAPDVPTLSSPSESNTIQALITSTVAAEVAEATAYAHKDSDAQMAFMRHQTAAALQTVKDEHAAALQAIKDEHAAALQATKNELTAQLEATKRQFTAALYASETKCTALENALAAYELRASNEAAKLQLSTAKALKVSEDTIAEFTKEIKATAMSMDDKLIKVIAQINEGDLRIHALQALAHESKDEVEELNEMVKALYPKLAVLGVSLQKAADKLGEDRVRLAEKADALRSEIAKSATAQMSSIKDQAKAQRGEITDLAKAQRGRVDEAAAAQQSRIAQEHARQMAHSNTHIAGLAALAKRQKAELVQLTATRAAQDAASTAARGAPRAHAANGVASAPVAKALSAISLRAQNGHTAAVKAQAAFCR